MHFGNRIVWSHLGAVFLTFFGFIVFGNAFTLRQPGACEWMAF
ncbi:Unknown protein sequence [Pseudomonas coronafaciens pv. oryzae]|nr:Unknown protein sequence [Pseudomonas coronafaciens pv. oryzae]